MADNPARQPPVVWNNITDIPGVRQAAMLISIAACVALGVGIMFWARSPDMTSLYSKLDDDDAAEIVAALQAGGIQYELAAGTGTVMVAAGDVHEARLKLAGQGLPRGAGAGLELLQKDQGMGVSQFMENARYTHALETELGRTISSMQQVANARVHLALPRQSVFVRNRKEASASVMLRVYPGLLMQSGQVGAIVHLVASSVPGIEPGNVAVVDHQGHLLSGQHNAAESAQTLKQFEHTRRIEESFVQRIEEILTPLVGYGRVRAQVVADMDYTEGEETRERYDPNRTSLRSEQVSEEERLGGAGSEPSGIPGALSNQPPVTGADPVTAGVNENRESSPPLNRSSQATRNYEVDRTISRVRQPGNRLRRLSVAVILDNHEVVDEEGVVTSEPLSAEKVDGITALVREAVGFDAERGDTIKVLNSSFRNMPESEIEAAPIWEQPMIRDLVKQVLGVLLVLLLILMVIRPMARNLLQAPATMTAQLAGGATMALSDGAGGTVAGAPAAVAAPGQPSLAIAGDNYEQRIATAREMAGGEPERVAQVVKKWVANDG